MKLMALERLVAWSRVAMADPVGRYAVAVLLAVLVWLLVWALGSVLLRLSTRIARRTRTDLDDELLDRLRGPARWLAPVLGAHAAFAWLGSAKVVGAVEVAEGLLVTYGAVSAFELLIIEAYLEQRQGISTPPLVRQLIIGVIYGAVLLGVVGSVFGLDLTPLLATGSVTTVVLGFALQGPLSNLFAGLTLHLERHPAVGDWLLVDGREGKVEAIGWRSTRLRLLSDDELVVPNVTVTQAQVVNFSRPVRQCARLLVIPAPVDLDPTVLESWVVEVCSGIDGIVEERTPKLWMTSIEDYCIRYTVKLWVVEFQRHDDLESAFLKGMWQRFQRAGVPFPVRHQAIRVVSEPPPPFAGLAPPASPRPPEAP
jgi:small-conductance mechanosensitive channel